MIGLWLLLAYVLACVVGAELAVKPWRWDDTSRWQVFDVLLIAFYGPWLFPYLVVRALRK